MNQQTLPCTPPPELPRVGSFFSYRCLVSPQKCPVLEHKVSYKCSPNFYHFSSSITFIFVNRVFFAVFQFVKGSISHVRHVKCVDKICSNKWKTFYNGLKFLLKSLLFDDNFKIYKFILMY